MRLLVSKCECCGRPALRMHTFGIDLELMHVLCGRCQLALKWWARTEPADSRKKAGIVRERLARRNG